MIFIVGLVLLGLIAWICLSVAGSIGKKVEKRRAEVISKYELDELYIDDAGRLIGFRFDDQSVVYGTHDWGVRLPLSAITSVEVRRNGVQITRANRGSQLAGAAIGGLLFGVPGAMVGGLSGSSTTSDKLRSVGLAFTFDHLKHPAHEVTFGVWPGQPQSEHSLLASLPMRNLERCHARVVNALNPTK